VLALTDTYDILRTSSGGAERGGIPVSDEVELVSDGDGLAILGESSAVERFLSESGLARFEKVDFGRALSRGAALAEVGSLASAQSGRWVKLTAESAQKIKKYGLTPTKTPGVSYAMAGSPGKIKNWLKIEQGLGTVLTNPLMLTNAAAIMSQIALEQQMREIKEYLAVIDEKLDHLLRSQVNQILSRIDGAELATREAMQVRESVGRVSDVTWSKVQNSAHTIYETIGFALRQIGDIAGEIESKVKIADLDDYMGHVHDGARKWLTVLARCLALIDAVGVLELDRVLDASPDELDRHRLGLRSARQDRNDHIASQIDDLLDRVRSAVERANSRVLFNPKQSPSVIASSNHIAEMMIEFLNVLEIDSARAISEARLWKEAATESWNRARDAGTQGLDEAKRLGGNTLRRASIMKDKVSEKIAESKSRRPNDSG